MTSFLCALLVSRKVKWVYPADPLPHLNHKLDLLRVLAHSRADWSTPGGKVQAESKRPRMFFSQRVKHKENKTGKALKSDFIITINSKLAYEWKIQDKSIKTHYPAQCIVVRQRPQSCVSGEKAEQMGITIFEEIESFS